MIYNVILYLYVYLDLGTLMFVLFCFIGKKRKSSMALLCVQCLKLQSYRYYMVGPGGRYTIYVHTYQWVSPGLMPIY